MSLLDYKSFLLNESILNEGKSEDEKFNSQDIVDAIKKFTTKIKIEEKRNTFEIWTYLKDRDSQAGQINELLKKEGFEIDTVMRSSSGSFPATEFYLDGILIRIVFKPTGGQQMTTLNSTITELIPILLWKAGYSGPADPEAMIIACRTVNLSLVNWASKSDMAAAEKYLDMFEESPMYKEKMENAYGIYQWILSQSPKDLIWCYRVKPYNVPAKSRADLYLEPSAGSPFGVSVKAKSTGSAKVRKMSSTFFELTSFYGEKWLDDVVKWGWDNVYSGLVNQYISEFPEDAAAKKITESNYWTKKGRAPQKNKDLLKIIDHYWKKDPKNLDQLGYYKIQSYVRDTIANMAKVQPDTWTAFIKDKTGIGSVFPVKVVEAFGSKAHEVHTDTEDSIAAVIESRPVTTESSKTSIKSFSVTYGSEGTYVYDVWNDGGGNKTAAFYDFRVAQIG
jgi:hypothetical protein